MTYTRVVRARHQCPVPWLIFGALYGYGVGTEWTCDSCGTVWLLCGNGHIPTKWEKRP